TRSRRRRDRSFRRYSAGCARVVPTEADSRPGCRQPDCRRLAGPGLGLAVGLPADRVALAVDLAGPVAAPAADRAVAGLPGLDRTGRAFDLVRVETGLPFAGAAFLRATGLPAALCRRPGRDPCRLCLPG